MNFFPLTFRNLISFFVDAVRGRHRSSVDASALVVVMELRDELVRYRKALEVIADGGADAHTIARWALRRDVKPSVRA